MGNLTPIIISTLLALIIGGVAQYMIFRYGLKKKYNRILEEAAKEAEVMKRTNCSK